MTRRAGRRVEHDVIVIESSDRNFAQCIHKARFRRGRVLSQSPLTMATELRRRSSFIDPNDIGKPAPRQRRHKRSATGYLPEKDAKTGEEVWPRGDPEVRPPPLAPLAPLTTRT